MKVVTNIILTLSVFFFTAKVFPQQNSTVYNDEKPALVMTINTLDEEKTYNPLSVSGNRTELTTGSWVMTDVKTEIYNRNNITKWVTSSGEIDANCTWKDMLDIVHTVNSGFKWQDPPKTMKPGSFLDIEAKYINIEYSTTGKVIAGLKMFIERAGGNNLIMEPDAIEVMKISKDNKHYNSEIMKGFFTAPKTLFDDTNDCQLIVDCYLGQDHYVTTYIYKYHP